MPNRRAVVIGLLVLTLVAFGLGLWSWLRPQNLVQNKDSGQPISGANLGVVYVPVTARSAPYYRLDIDSGALITEVVPGSVADQVGLQPGDVILSFNDTVLQEGVSLVSLLMECTSGSAASPHEVFVRVWREGCVHSIELTHAAAPVN